MNDVNYMKHVAGNCAARQHKLMAGRLSPFCIELEALH